MASRPLAGIWRRVRGRLSSSALQCMSCSDAGLDGRILPRLEASFPRNPLMDIILSEEFPPAVQKLQTLGAETLAFDKNAYLARRYKACMIYQTVHNASARVGQHIATLKPHLTRLSLNGEENPVGGCRLASTNVTQESCDHDSPRRGFGRGKELPMGSASERGNKHLPSAGNTGDVIAILKHCRKQGIPIDSYRFVDILKRCSIQKDIVATRLVHDYIIHSGMQKQRYVATTLLNAYIKCGSLHDARRVFDGLTKFDRNVITWTVMIGAYAKSGCGVEAYRLFLQMKQEGVIPDGFTYVSILNASASVGALEWVKEVHSDALKAGLESDLRVGNALVLMYAKCGSIADARLVFERMEKRDVITWTLMIDGLAEHGCGHEALELFKKMNVDCVQPNGTTFVAVLSACSHAGFVDDGRQLFVAMTRDYGIQPTVVHHNCMVDLLGRAGHLVEAKRFIDNMPLDPDAVTWKSLLGACRTHGNVELGELAGKEVLKLKPKDAGVYVLLCNIYSAAGKWEKVSLMRKMMQERGVRKEPGRSWIEVDSKIHDFVMGDTAHPEAKAIYSELSKLTEELKAEGYFPDTQVVLRDISEEDKELALCSHSEKLAIAYGLMRVPKGKPIRVYKNLRVCSDCHEATKLISKVTGREIIARDASRFHHFKDGVCSCGDYW